MRLFTRFLFVGLSPILNLSALEAKIHSAWKRSVWRSKLSVARFFASLRKKLNECGKWFNAFIFTFRHLELEHYKTRLPCTLAKVSPLCSSTAICEKITTENRKIAFQPYYIHFLTNEYHMERTFRTPCKRSNCFICNYSIIKL